MSQVKVQKPVVHIPRFNRWGVPYSYVDRIIGQLGLKLLYPNGVHELYFYTDSDGCAKLLPHLLLKSDLYKPRVFTCINYAFRAWNLCSEVYELNTWVPVIGRLSGYDNRHAWILIMRGSEKGLSPDEFLYFEPNDSWKMSEELEMAYQAFPISKEGYKGEFIFY